MHLEQLTANRNIQEDRATSSTRIREVLQQRDGVLSVDVDLLAQTIAVRFDSDKTGPRDFIEDLDVC